ncbi:DUF4418 family protein [Treponema primitia]|uniref:DUF4418 family protein n=1 Tax=Treponema primitia TaxID=88058 RepID=UPI00025553CD|nr:DUF4418 family protein [Treponema primitia]
MSKKHISALPISAVFFIIIGLFIALGPLTLFPVCKVVGTMIMKCFWTARAELGIGLVIAILGALNFWFKSPQIRLGLGIGIFLNALLALFIPTVLIGVCDHGRASCRVLALPALTVLSNILLLGAILNGLILVKTKLNK